MERKIIKIEGNFNLLDKICYESLQSILYELRKMLN